MQESATVCCDVFTDDLPVWDIFSNFASRKLTLGTKACDVMHTI